MPVGDNIKALIKKRKLISSARRFELNSQRKQNLFAQFHIRRIAFDCRRIFIGVSESKQKLSATGFHIHQFHAVVPIFLNNLSKIPR